MSINNHHDISRRTTERTMDTKNCTIAFVTDDGTTISSHFGRAMYYEIITLQDGKAADRKHVSKAGHHSFGPEAHQAGHDHNDDHKHAAMTAPLSGVSVLVSRGMGMGAQQHLLGMGIQPVLTGLHAIDEAVAAFVAGILASDDSRVHTHGAHQH
jgi:predicted Fe-Mo cluster-binding NifX family protein